MVVPTASELMAISEVPFDDLLTGDVPAKVDRLILWSTGEIRRKTGRIIVSGVEFPDGLDSTIDELLVRLVEYKAYNSTEDQRETRADNAIASFTAGRYSETRRSLGEFAKLLHPDPEIAALMKDAFTDEKLEEWEILIGRVRPAWTFVEFDWNLHSEPDFWP